MAALTTLCVFGFGSRVAGCIESVKPVKDFDHRGKALFEHRRRPHRRKVVITMMGE